MTYLKKNQAVISILTILLFMTNMSSWHASSVYFVNILEYSIEFLSREEEEGVVLGPLGLHARLRLDLHKIRISTNSFKKILLHQ